MEQYLNQLPKNRKELDVNDRLSFFKHNFTEKSFTRNDYLKAHKKISTSTASRDLAYATKNGILERIGTKNNTRYKFTNP